MSSSYLLTNVMLPTESLTGVDVFVRDGLVAEISPAGGPSPVETTIVQSDGLVLLPSFIDLHTHIREPGKLAAETAATASASAAAGGFTAIHAMANTTPVADNPEVINAVWQRGQEVGLVDIRPVGAVTMGLRGTHLAPMATMHATAAAPILFSDDGHCVNRADVMREALREVAEFDGVIAQHAQEATLTVGAQANEGEIARKLGLPGWPSVAESIIIARDVLLAADTGARLHICHVSTAASVDVIRWAKQRGVPVTAEVTPHHLILTDVELLSGNPVFKVNPPLRTQKDVDAVREALADGTIDVVASDHAPHEDKDKSCSWHDAAMGMLGLETAFSIVYEVMVATGRMDWRRLAEVMSWNAAHIARLTPPSLTVGSPASFTLVNPAAEWTVTSDTQHSLSRNTPFVERAMRGRVVSTFRDGRPTFIYGQVRTQT
jgi:dihydroorotase